jgi:DNA polymerase I-like protein with 3'-5' exonuclease and polymerase domains
MRDFRLENALFWPHMRNTSYEAFFKQMTEQKLPQEYDVATQAASMWLIERETMTHPILDLEIAVARVLAEMEVVGVFVDTHIL